MAEINQQRSTAPTGVKSLSTFLNSDSIKNKFTEILGQKGVGFISSVLTVVNSNNLLKNADQNSIYTAALIAASLDLPINPNLGFAYIVPYNESYLENGAWKKRQVAQFQMGYKGFVQLAQRSGQYSLINSTDVREGELKHFNRLTGEMVFEFIQNPAERLSKEIIGYVSYFQLTNGFEHSFYMTSDEMLAHAKEYSQTFKKDGKGLWKDKFPMMALKTVTKLNLSKNGPLSIELQRAVLVDQAVIKSDSFLDDPETICIETEYADNQEQTKEEKVDDKKLAMKEKKEAAAKKEDTKNQEPPSGETSPENEQDMYVRISACKTLPELSLLAKEIPSDDFDLAIALDNKKRELSNPPSGDLFNAKEKMV
ncbi:recombinase RecT [Flavobacterium sp.]|uniref:recombinase RecT n=1 Tax=Flavobacterium sp. TaxID=239 RepID=UPI003D6AA1BF